jgi:K+-transporting ATPase KdpF subunit
MYGLRVRYRVGGPGRVDGRSDLYLRQAGGTEMTWLYWLSGAASAGLLVYLVYALFNAEDF